MARKDLKVTAHLEPLEEVVGEVHRVDRHSVTLLCVVQYLVYLDDMQIKKWKKSLRKGAEVGILQLEDGTIRVRSIEPKGERK